MLILHGSRAKTKSTITTLIVFNLSTRTSCNPPPSQWKSVGVFRVSLEVTNLVKINHNKKTVKNGSILFLVIFIFVFNVYLLKFNQRSLQRFATVLRKFKRSSLFQCRFADRVPQRKATSRYSASLEASQRMCRTR